MKITRFEDIDAWKAARELSRLVYAATKRGTFRSDYDLCRQVRRAGSSAMSNIAEGFDGGSDTEFRRFLRIAQRSTTETQSRLYEALDQKYLSDQDFQSIYQKAAEVRRRISGFIRYLTENNRNRKALP